MKDLAFDLLAVVADEGQRQLAAAGTLKSVARYWSP